MRKENLVQQLFDRKLAITGKQDSVYVYFEKLIKTNLYNVFTTDLVKTFKYFQGQHKNELNLIVNMRKPVCKNLAEIISKELGIKLYGEFYRSSQTVKNCLPDSDYVFLGHCIANGKSLRSAETRLAEFNSHIKYGLYFIDVRQWANTLQGLDVEIYATLYKNDLKRKYQFPPGK